MADPAAICTTQPLVFGLLVPGTDATAWTAGLHTTVPLALGLNLRASAFSLACAPFNVSITHLQVALRAGSDTADVVVPHPLSVGLLLGTSGTTNYTLTAERFNVPVTMRDVVLRTNAPAGIQTTIPLALGILLDAQSYSLACAPFNVAINFAPGEGEEFFVADELNSLGGRKRRRLSPKASGEVYRYWVMDTLAKVAATGAFDE